MKHSIQNESPTDINKRIHDASSNIGQTVKVCAIVYGTKELKSGMTFINQGAAYPNSPLTLVIYGDNMSNFKQNPSKYYDGKRICVTGKSATIRAKHRL